MSRLNGEPLLDVLEKIARTLGVLVTELLEW
jgi:hypothetical protein